MFYRHWHDRGAADQCHFDIRQDKFQTNMRNCFLVCRQYYFVNKYTRNKWNWMVIQSELQTYSSTFCHCKKAENGMQILACPRTGIWNITFPLKYELIFTQVWKMQIWFTHLEWQRWRSPKLAWSPSWGEEVKPKSRTRGWRREVDQITGWISLSVSTDSYEPSK